MGRTRLVRSISTARVTRVSELRERLAAHEFTGATKPFLLLAKLSRNKAGLPTIPVKQRGTIMLSEKFILVLEAILKSNGRGFPDGAPRVVSTSAHVPVKLPASK
jgi:hypothetical protein